jgi:mRNA interferase MazF
LDVVNPRRFDVFLVRLDPAQGAEMQKTRPCVVISPDESNDMLRTVVVAPLSSRRHGYPGRVAIRFQDRDGEIGTDQLRAVDKSRLIRRVGALPEGARLKLVRALVEFFS